MLILGLQELLLSALTAYLVLGPVILLLRFVRRGAARFGMAPAMAAVALLPVVVGAAIGEIAFRRTLEQTAVTGSGGTAALASGSVTALLFLTMSVGTVAPLAFSAAVLLAVGSSRAPADQPGPGPTGSVLSVAVAALAAGGLALMARPVLSVNAGLRDPEAIRGQWWIAAAAVLILGLILLALFVTPFLRAARGAAPFAIKLLSVGALCSIGMASLGGLWAMSIPLNRLADGADAPVPFPASDEASLAAHEPTPRVDAAAGVAPALGAAHGAADPVRVGGAVPEPHKVKNVQPVYPDIAKQARVQGVVILECTIGLDGKVADIKVLRGIPLLDAAAVDAVRQWEYTPTLLNGVPVPVIMTVTVNFRLA